MVKPINRDIMILSAKSAKATIADVSVADDLLDTLKANAEHCVGMAANMIGISKCIIAIAVGPFFIAMLNPVITKKSGKYETEEGCLSLDGVRKTTRYKTIEVEFEDKNFKKQKQTFTDFTAQIIQHEIDHCNGILI